MNQKMDTSHVELEIYKEYRDILVPFIVTLEALDVEFPVEVLNEIRSIFTHFSVYKLEDCEGDLHLARRHLKRAILDCHKYACVSIEESIERFHHVHRDVNLSVANNGEFLPELNRLHQAAIRCLYNAKCFESSQKSTSNGEEAETEALYRKYEEAWEAYSSLNEFLNDSQQAINFAKHQSKKQTVINIVSIVIGVLGIVVGLVAMF